MKLLYATKLFLALSLVVASSAQAQLKRAEGRNSYSTEIALDDALLTRTSRSQAQEYNPWTVHRKVAQYGLAGSMAATLLGSLAMQDEFFETTVIPVVGPFVTIARVEGNEQLFYRSGGKTLLIASGATQSAFLIYLVTAYIGETNYAGRNQSGFSVYPTTGSKGTGLSLRYRF
jgi:hypothetical protein